MQRKWCAAAPVIAAVTMLATSASAQAPAGTTITLRELDKGSKFVFIDQAPKSKSKKNPTFSMGDQSAFLNPLVDASGAKLGTLYATCTVMTPGGFAKVSLLCQGVYRLPTGELHAQAFVKFSQNTTIGAVTGGTGAYANARGTFTSVSDKNGNSDTTINLAG
jgi:hypothetical protein